MLGLEQLGSDNKLWMIRLELILSQYSVFLCCFQLEAKKFQKDLRNKYCKAWDDFNRVLSSSLFSYWIKLNIFKFTNLLSFLVKHFLPMSNYMEKHHPYMDALFMCWMANCISPLQLTVNSWPLAMSGYGGKTFSHSDECYWNWKDKCFIMSLVRRQFFQEGLCLPFSLWQ